MRRTSQMSVPMPKIIGVRTAARRTPSARSGGSDRKERGGKSFRLGELDRTAVHAHRFRHAELERIGDQRVADRDLENAGNGGEKRAEVVAVEVVAGVDAEAGALRCLRGGAEARELAGLARRAERRGIRLGVEL